MNHWVTEDTEKTRKGPEAFCQSQRRSDRPPIVYCQVGQRGYLSLRLLRRAGFDAANLSGGWKTYQLFAGASPSA